MKKIITLLASMPLIIGLNAKAEISEAATKGLYMVRLKGMGMFPKQQSSFLPAGGVVKPGNSFGPELSFTYFFDVYGSYRNKEPNLALELSLALTSQSLKAISPALGNVDLGRAWVFPPMLLLQYHFTGWCKAKPYIGGGLSYVAYFGTKPGSQTSVKYQNNFGGVAQIGVDIPVKGQWFINLDVRKMWVKLHAVFNGGAAVADAKMNPWIFGAGVSYRF
jgi:outer membrane protein